MKLTTNVARFGNNKPISFVKVLDKFVPCYYPPADDYDPNNTFVDIMFTGIHFNKDNGTFAGFRVKKIGINNFPLIIRGFEISGKEILAKGYHEGFPENKVTVSPGYMKRFVNITQAGVAENEEPTMKVWALRRPDSDVYRLDGVDDYNTLDIERIVKMIKTSDTIE